MVSPHRTFCLALTSSVFMETTGSNLSGTRSTRGAFFTFFGKIYTPHLNLLPIFLHLRLWRYTLRCLVAVPQDTDCVTTIKTTEEKLANKKKELEVFQVLQKTNEKNAFQHAWFFHVLFNNDSLFSVWILWDKKEIRRCQGETWEWCERYHRTDSG